jgi:phosphoserine aminotransferase
MNVPFIINNGDEKLEKKFLDEATKTGLINLAGHRSVGGLRASIYNGVPIEGVDTLVTFMKNFQETNAL